MYYYMPCSPPQDQYAFIHDALCDYLTCGDTSILAHQLRGEIRDMDKVDNDTRMSGFESQFKVQSMEMLSVHITFIPHGNMAHLIY